MSKTRWFFLWLLFVGYLFLGASVFYVIERALEEERRVVLIAERNEIHDLLRENFIEHSHQARELILDRLTEYCGKPFTKILNSTAASINDEPYHWSFYNSFFFTLTTLSTIGYGNISPSSSNAKIIMIFYCLIGIPFNGIVLSQLGEFFGSVFLRAHYKYKNRVYESCAPLIFDILLYLSPGLLIIIIVPAVLVSYVEGWTLLDSVYFTFVSLTTIGFGDFVAGQKDLNSPWYGVYKVVLVVWVMFGLGYLVMVMGFISRGLRSKKMHSIETKLATTIKQTRSKLWNEFLQDITYVRRVINEVYLNRVKPVYREDKKIGLVRSKSCPNFESWPVPLTEEETSSEEGDMLKPSKPRRRAFSEFVGTTKLVKVLSESHLEMIDRNATFDNTSINTIDSKQLWAKMMDAFRAEKELEALRGIDCFTDEEILASEEYSSRRGSVMNSKPPKKRGRAYSCVTRPHPYFLNISDYSVQKTWTGNDLMDQEDNSAVRKNSTYLEPNGNLLETPASSTSTLRRMSTAAANFLSVNNLTGRFWRRKSSVGKTVSEIKVSREKRLSLPENIHPDYTEKRRRTILEAFQGEGMEGFKGNNPVLENTSIADFLRLLSSVENLRKEDDLDELPLVKLFQQSPPSERRFMRVTDMDGDSNSSSRRRSHSSATSSLRRRAISHSESLDIPRSCSPSNDGSFRERKSGLGVSNKTRRISYETPRLVVTGPEGTHRFSVQSSGECSENKEAELSEIITHH